MGALGDHRCHGLALLVPQADGHASVCGRAQQRIGKPLQHGLDENVAQVHAARKRTRAESLSAQPGMTKPVVGRALVGVAQHLVCLAGFFKLFLGCMVAGIAVRMIFQRLLSVRALEFLVAAVARDTQNLVIIRFAHSCIRPHSSS